MARNIESHTLFIYRFKVSVGSNNPFLIERGINYEMSIRSNGW